MTQCGEDEAGRRARGPGDQGRALPGWQKAWEKMRKERLKR